MSKRIGLLIPSSNTVMEVDFCGHAPAGVTVHTGRMYMEDTTVEGESRMLDEFALPAARDVGTARPRVIVFGCTSAGALRGNDYDAQLCRRLAEAARARPVSTIASVRAAIAERKVRRVGVCTPYNDDLNAGIRRSLEDDGLEVVRISGLGITENFTIAEVTPEEILAFATRELRGLPIDLAFLSCTNFRAWDAAPRVEAALGVPVLTSNMAVFAAAVAALEEDAA